MKKRALKKDFYMEIRKSLGRFLSIFFIVALGVSFFSGIRAAEPDMRLSGDVYFDQNHLMDLKVMGTLGLTKDDVDAIQAMGANEAVEAGYSQDMLLTVEGNQKVVHVMSMPETMNAVTVSEGRLPNKPGECLVDVDFLQMTSYEIGDWITLESDQDNNILKENTFQIVGAGSSPCYISFGRGSSLIGTGSVSGFLVVTDENFQGDFYTELYVTAKGAREAVSFTEAYDDAVDQLKEQIEAIADARCEARRDGLRADANEELDQARQELADGKKKADEELAKALQELSDGEAKLAEAKVQLQDGRKQLADAREMLAGKQKDIDRGKKEYAGAKDAFGKKQEAFVLEEQAFLAKEQEALPQLQAAEQQLAEARAALDAGWKNYEAIKDSEDVMQQAIAEEMRKSLEAKEAEWKQGTAAFEAQKKQLADGKEAIAQAKLQLAAGEQALAKTEKQLLDGQRQIDAARKEMQSKEQGLTAGEQELAVQEQKLFDGRQKYETAKQEAEAEIADGELKIADAEAEIAKIKMPEWYVETRDALPDFSQYGENADRMRAIGKVFPVLFFLVAALISLTTMTRMVEEQRTQIGTLQALGYSKFDIARKYLHYAFLATMGGSIFGVLIGEKVFPYIIVYAYKIMYRHLPDILVPYHLSYAVMATVAAVVCTFVATFAACYKELLALPAVLMRPPSPKQGKRISLERIPFLWKRFNFIWKSAIRNLFRYKKRFFMTIIGIGGCMGLMLVGFGLKDSIVNIARLQYGELQTYDGMAYLETDASEESLTKLYQMLADHPKLGQYSEAYMKNKKVKSESGEEELYLNVPVKKDGLDAFMTFRDRVTKETYALSDDGVILTEKVADKLGVKVGDEIRIQEEIGEHTVKVSHICENYIGYYMYMTPGLYETLYGEAPKTNHILFDLKTFDEKELMKVGEQLMKEEAVLNVSYTNNMEGRIESMLGSLNLVIIVLIISAGMLAFVVLYNLNNINITERKRELATLKVLGFYDKEVAAYVFRENVMLTVIGSFVGMALGKLLHQFVIVTVEVEGIMFGRNIDFPSFLFSFLFTLGFSLFVNWVMYFKLKRINMVESLKSVE